MPEDWNFPRHGPGPVPIPRLAWRFTFNFTIFPLFFDKYSKFELLKAQGVPEPIVYWKHAERALEDQKGISDSILTLIDVSEADSGRYTCVASSLAGSVTQDIHLTVHQPPQMIVLDPTGGIQGKNNLLFTIMHYM